MVEIAGSNIKGVIFDMDGVLLFRMKFTKKHTISHSMSMA